VKLQRDHVRLQLLPPALVGVDDTALVLPLVVGQHAAGHEFVPGLVVGEDRRKGPSAWCCLQRFLCYHGEPFLLVVAECYHLKELHEPVALIG